MSLYVVHGATAALPLPDSQNRILRETHGFRGTGGASPRVWTARSTPTATNSPPCCASTRPDLAATQWPGLTRPSEYLLGQIAPRVDPAAQTQPFWIITRRPEPPVIAGASVIAQRTLFDCVDQGLVETAQAPCARPLHEWHLYRYQLRPEH